MKQIKKNAFTLIELLAVIIILAIIALIAVPIILDVVDDARKSAGLSESNMIYTSINNYCASIEMKKQLGTLDSEDFDCEGKTTFTTEEISKMVNLGSATVESNSYANGKLTSLVVISNNNKYVLCSNGSMALESDGCETTKTVYKDNSGANYPKLLDNMIPIKYDGENWIYADIYNEWYDYDTKEWANAVVLNDNVDKNVGDPILEEDIALWYVWIPRYTYTIFNGNNESVNEQEIKIKFENGTNSNGTVECVDAVSGSGESSEICTDLTNENIINGTSTYTHPAFTFGDQELTGFWVGKFEVSGTTDKITIKPNITSLRNQNVSAFFTAIQNMSSEDQYNLNGDSHMIKNMEWGAVAYLSHSIYGTCTNGECEEVNINNNNSYYTGGGTSNAYKTNTIQSTTQNVYGVYDMNGGSWEYVMGNMVNSAGDFYSSSSGFDKSPSITYYDSYTYGTSNLSHERGKLGDATKETLKQSGNLYGSWYGDYADFPYLNVSWFIRGATNSMVGPSGIFSFSYTTGIVFDSVSSRVVLYAE